MRCLAGTTPAQASPGRTRHDPWRRSATKRSTHVAARRTRGPPPAEHNRSAPRPGGTRAPAPRHRPTRRPSTSLRNRPARGLKPERRKCGSWLGWRRTGRERNPEMRPRPGFRKYLDPASMGEDEFPGDGETQAAPTQPAPGSVHAVVEPVEDFLAVLGRYSGTRVTHVEHDFLSLLLQRQRNHTFVG